MDGYKPNSADKFMGFLFKNKVNSIITFFVWSFIYKIIDLNTLQWWGKDMFINSDIQGIGNLIGFCVASIFSFLMVVLLLGSIYSFLTGKKY
jgi:hypothetical protein